MPAKYLKNMRNGVVLPYSKMLEKNHAHVVPVDTKEGTVAFEEVDATGEDEESTEDQTEQTEVVGSTGNEDSAQDLDSLDIEKASKKQLMQFSSKHFGVDIDGKQPIAKMRDEVRQLAQEE